MSHRHLVILGLIACASLALLGYYAHVRWLSDHPHPPSLATRHNITHTVNEDATPHASADRSRPNILWIVWDTVRSDRMSVYGAKRPTTPAVEQWAKGALVFDDVISSAHSTLPAHAAMFTGKLALQHGTHYGHPRLDNHHETLAEILNSAGYQTFLWSSNPHVSAAMNFTQGFSRIAHPWDKKHLSRAIEIVRDKALLDRGTGLADELQDDNAGEWAIKSAGELAIPTLLDWLKQIANNAPYFAFINFMEAHRHYVPPDSLRQHFLEEEAVARSHEMDVSYLSLYAYTFGLKDYSERDIEITKGLYDACLRELDGLFAKLLEALRAAGALDNTMIILTSDHGEHLGEHHMFDHQYTLYEPVLRVPLIIHFPERFPPGRSAAPVMNFDLFPTVLELVGLTPPPHLPSRSLLHPKPKRIRFADHPIGFRDPIEHVRKTYPSLDPKPWLKSMCALYDGSLKLIMRAPNDFRLYNLEKDPQEVLPLQEPSQLAQMQLQLHRMIDSLQGAATPPEPVPALSEEEQDRLRALGYVH